MHTFLPKGGKQDKVSEYLFPLEASQERWEPGHPFHSSLHNYLAAGGREGTNLLRMLEPSLPQLRASREEKSLWLLSQSVWS